MGGGIGTASHGKPPEHLTPNSLGWTRFGGDRPQTPPSRQKAKVRGPSFPPGELFWASEKNKCSPSNICGLLVSLGQGEKSLTSAPSPQRRGAGRLGLCLGRLRLLRLLRGADPDGHAPVAGLTARSGVCAGRGRWIPWLRFRFVGCPQPQELRTSPKRTEKPFEEMVSAKCLQHVQKG